MLRKLKGLSQESGMHSTPLLVAKHTGSSLVRFQGRRIHLHLLTRDFFITSISINGFVLTSIVFAVYLSTFLFWSGIWYIVMRYYPGCLYGATTYVECFVFSVITQMTIGYGNTGPQACWAAAWIITCQSLTGLLLEAVTIGIIFSRISHPKQRSRSIFISESAIIARRDGILKFMFRVADIRSTQVVDPQIKAFMYTWGEGRITAEGERIPVRCEAIELGYIDGMLLLPLIIEHTIDERSPLCGHTHDSLAALNAEIVVTFEGTTEFGNPFMARRSFAVSDIHWGRQFVDIILKPTDDDTHYSVDLEHFDAVEPQHGLPRLPPSQLSELIVHRAKRTVPYPLLGENTLVMSDVLCVAPNAQGKLTLSCRVADTYPNQMVEMTVRAYLYRWSHEPDEPQSFAVHPLEVGYHDGSDRLFLRLPMEVEHVLEDPDSPLYSWYTEQGVPAEDRDSEIVFIVNGYMLVNSQNRIRQRTYRVGSHVRFGYRFAPIVKHPQQSRDLKPRVRWAHFHEVVRDTNMLSESPRLTTSSTKFGSRRMLDGKAREDFTLMPGIDLARYQAMVAAAGDTMPRASAQHAPVPEFLPAPEEQSAEQASHFSKLFPEVATYTATTTEAVDSVPHPTALRPTLREGMFALPPEDQASEVQQQQQQGSGVQNGEEEEVEQQQQQQRQSNGLPDEG